MIQFHSDHIDMPALAYQAVKSWMQRVILSHGKREGIIDVIFCSDERILEINQAFLQHDYYTDIITFDNGVGGVVSGEIYISLDTVASNAAQMAVDPNQELHRVIIHGVLHLCGYPDKQPEEAVRMRALEDEALSICNSFI